MIRVMVTGMPVECVMLAAGESRRMGRWKMLLPMGDATVVERSVENALAVCGTVYLVVGHRGEELLRLFAGRRGVVCVMNRRYAEGMFSSVKAGMARLEGGRCFLALADMPLVGPDVYRRLLEAPPTDCVAPVHGGKRGHPVLLSRAVCAEAARADEGAVLRDILNGFPTLLLPVDDPHVLTDLDTAEDFANLDDPGVRPI
jgi:molybdenum cofactor cytidylyltransferase